MLEVRLLGNFHINSGKRSITLASRPAQSLFPFLILHSGTSYRREKLAGLLWPESTEEAARDYLRQHAGAGLLFDVHPRCQMRRMNGSRRFMMSHPGVDC